jgi:ABC-type proline/glycine betaine transport system permease subunit
LLRWSGMPSEARFTHGKSTDTSPITNSAAFQFRTMHTLALCCIPFLFVSAVGVARRTMHTLTLCCIPFRFVSTVGVARGHSAVVPIFSTVAVSSTK